MFRRAKLLLDRDFSTLARTANGGDRRMVATVDLTDRFGEPCARLKPDALTWSVE